MPNKAWQVMCLVGTQRKERPLKTEPAIEEFIKEVNLQQPPKG